MRRIVGSEVDRLVAGLDAVAGVDVAGLDDASLCAQVRQLVTVADRVQAELVRRVGVFDRRELARPDGFATTKGWLQAFTRVSGVAAHRLVRTARLLRELPKLAHGFQSGRVPAESLPVVSRLVDRIGVDKVAEVEPTLADAAAGLDPARFGVVCDRVRAHVDPDGPDPGERYARRGVTLSPVAGMVAVRGQLDPEGGAALTVALDAVMTPPGEGDERSPAQRRADALVELARRPLAAGGLPSVGGQRPQVGVLVFPQALSPETLAGMAEAQADSLAGERLRQFLASTRGTPSASAGAAAGAAADAAADAAGEVWRRPGWADPPWLHWVGPVAHVTAQRLACDADVFRIVLDPANGMPLDVGRAHRLVPHWIRKALYARDRGCRWPGCTTPAEWTDGHHLDPWADGGQTTVERLLLLCRHHHGLVHEGGWTIDLDPVTAQVRVTRPGGVPYGLPRNLPDTVPRTRSPSWNGPTTDTS